MKIVCIICTELLLVKSHISVCTCGHLFHEECLFRWFKNGGPNTCPQCRSKQPEKNVIKRLFFNEQDIAASQRANLDEVSSENYEYLQNLVEEQKTDLLDLRNTMATKSKSIEEKDAKIKELNKSLANTKKTFSENQLLLDYLKKELESFGNLKKQYDAREKLISELESKIREYKSIEMIYKEHEHTFNNEMKKYLEPVYGKQNNITHYQSIVRQLVSTNVLLKENADKQMEEKRVLRKKLIHIESRNSDRDKKMQQIEAELGDLKEQNDKLHLENKKKQFEFDNWKKKAQSLIAKRSSTSILQQSIATPTLNKENLIINDTIQIDELENTFDISEKNNSVNISCNVLNEQLIDSSNRSIEIDSKQQDDIDEFLSTANDSNTKNNGIDFDDDIIEMRCDSMFAKIDEDFLNSPIPKRRKNPFISCDLNDQESEAIPAFQKVPKSSLFKFKSFNEMSLSQRFKDSPKSEVKIVKPIVANSKRPRLRNLDHTIADSPKSIVNEVPKNAFTYLSDGFGGRTKVHNKNDKIMPINNVKLGIKRSSFLTKSKVSK